MSYAHPSWILDQKSQHPKKNWAGKGASMKARMGAIPVPKATISIGVVCFSGRVTLDSPERLEMRGRFVCSFFQEE